MATWEPDEIDFEDQYDKADPIDDADLDISMNLLNEFVGLNGHQRIKMNEQNWNNR